MGTWGTGISLNDTYADVYREFFHLYDEGKEVDEITERLIAGNWEILEIPEDANNFWFALAKAQWDCKELQANIFEKVRDILDSGSDLRFWKDQGASEPEIKKRQKVLNRFLEQLQSERPKAKSRKRKVIREPIFAKGDCLTFKLANGNYGGAVVLEAEYNTEHGLNLVAATRINQPKQPELSEFENAEVLLKNFGQWNGNEGIIWIFKYRIKEVRTLFELVGSIRVNADYLARENKYKYPFTSGWKSAVINSVNSQFESEKVKQKPAKRLTVRELTKARSWKFW